MTTRTGKQYAEGLRDGRVVYYRGRRVEDVTADAELRIAVEHAAADFDLATSPNRDLAVATDPESGEEYSAYYEIPRTAEQLLRRSKLIELGTAEGGTLVTLVHEIGTDALFALQRVLTGEPLARAEAYYRYCRDNDLSIAVAQTDAKGDRGLGPSEQPDPDLYVRVKEQTDDGIVVSGAKVHTSVSANADELIVLPTRALGPSDQDYAVAFAVPVATPGVSLYVSAYSAGARNEFEFPLSSRHKMLETLTVFDNVFVPWERVFLCRQPELAGPLALTFVEYHRFTAVSYKLPLVDALVGASIEIAAMNGVAGRGHLRDKLAQLVTYAETVRALTEMAAIRCRIGNGGIAYPDPLTTNMAKLTFASRYHEMLELVQDCAGGLLVTGPGGEDWASSEVRPVLEKYFRAKALAEPRLRMMNLIGDLTTRDFGGYHAVLAIHAEGSIEAEKLQIVRSYDSSRATAYARRLAGVDDLGS
jgi:aromatic ring hydroxylase